MSGATLTPVEDADRSDVGTTLSDPAERGTLTVHDRVVERVAGYAVTQVDAATAAPRRILGVNVGDAREQSAVHVQAKVDGHSATVDATIAVRWPASIREVVERTRQRVRDDVLRMTDVTVDHIDIDVVSLSVPTRATPRVR